MKKKRIKILDQDVHKINFEIVPSNNDNHLDMNRNKEWFWLMPIYLTVFIIPLLVSAKKVYLSETNSHFTKYASSYVDLFAFQRSQFLLWMGVIGLLLLLLHRLDGDKHQDASQDNNFTKKISVLTFSYLTLIICSMLLSEYKDLSFFGALQRFEGGLVLISYLVLFWMSVVFLNRKVHVSVLSNFIITSASIVVFLGFLQVAQIDFYKFEWFNQWVYLFEAEKGNLVHANEKIKQIFATLYNTNYYGTYVALVFPFFLGLYHISDKLFKKFLSLILIVITWSSIFGSESRTAFLGALFGLIGMSFWAFLRKVQIRKILVCFMMIPIGFMLTTIFIGDSFLSRFNMINPINEKAMLYESRSKVNDLSFLKQEVLISIDKNIVRFIWKDNNFVIKNDLNVELKASLDSDKKRMVFQDVGDGKYSYKLLHINENLLINVKLNNIHFDLYADDKGIFLISPQATKFNYEETAKVFGFKNNQHFGAFRGHIWSRTIPLLCDTILFGHGPDTFIAYYPQKDWTSLLNNFGSVLIIDKPHNYYLQVAHDTGIISLVILLILFASYLLKSLSFIRAKFKFSDYYWYNAMFMTSISCYLFALIFNDSVVYIAPVFWVILGAGCAVIKIASSHKTDI